MSSLNTKQRRTKRQMRMCLWPLVNYEPKLSWTAVRVKLFFCIIVMTKHLNNKRKATQGAREAVIWMFSDAQRRLLENQICLLTITYDDLCKLSPDSNASSLSEGHFHFSHDCLCSTTVIKSLLKLKLLCIRTKLSYAKQTIIAWTDWGLKDSRRSSRTKLSCNLDMPAE